MSLGAGSTEVVRMLMTSGIKVAALGSALGIVLAFAAARFLGALLFNVSTSDLQTFVLVPALLVAAATLAA